VIMEAIKRTLRGGKYISPIPKGHPRAMADAKSGWRNMTREQQRQFTQWALDHQAPPSTTIHAQPERRTLSNMDQTS
jgi:hypothetical protein